MRFHADLHVHSKYSRATSRDLDLEHLAHWAARKGIAVVGTGDFTHPAWRDELKQKLVPAEPGLFRLRDDVEQAVWQSLPPACRRPVRFMLEVEISTIYKKGERTRKIHHLIYAPDLASVERISERLGRIGNIASDGRPILGLDSRDLLEITLEASPGAYLVPAHIWTPWFAALGSQSGFESIAGCYGDLAEHIFAVETGLSSDPAMNWRVSFLDRYRLVSNSDAHSPGKLGREATTFDCDLDYFAIRRALETGHGFVGTVEFFPEEGKYHLDGHRKCATPLAPRETLAHGGRCPVCGEKVTIGVLHRVEDLADRSETEMVPPSTAGVPKNLVPLPEILAEVTATGAASQKVGRSYDQLIATLGPELDVLASVPIEDIARRSSSLLGEAIARLRAGKVFRTSGYDGEYGIIRLFEDRELRGLTAGGLLFDASRPKGASAPVEHKAPHPIPPVLGERGAKFRAQSPPVRSTSTGILERLDADQRAAAQAVDGPLMIIAGPGSGKTRTLTHRIAHLVAERGLPAAHCLAITFTRRAAAEMRERLGALLADAAAPVAVHTFHSLGLAILREHPAAAGLKGGFRLASEAERKNLLVDSAGVSAHKAERLLNGISKARRTQHTADLSIADVAASYRRAMAEHNLIDFDDCIVLAAEALQNDPELVALYRGRFQAISVDEFQDVDEAQYRLLICLAPPDGNLCVIGDPDQAIYAFRGADASCFERFRQDFPRATVVRLARNYRSSGTIVAASSQIIAGASRAPIGDLARTLRDRITIHIAPTERSEAEFVVQTIEQLIGGHTFFSIDSGRALDAGVRSHGFGDLAVLYRTDAQSKALAEAFVRSGIPFRAHSHARLAEDTAVQALLIETEQSNEGDLAKQLAGAAERLASKQILPEPILRAALARLTAIAGGAARENVALADAAAVATDADFHDPRGDRVLLMTLHAAKGLEFPVVFIVGLEDGVLPLHWGKSDPAMLAEERRLLYVGMTRAKERLILSRAVSRRWRGRVQKLAPSPFLDDIESELLKHQRPEGLRRRPEDLQLKLL